MEKENSMEKSIENKLSDFFKSKIDVADLLEQFDREDQGNDLPGKLALKYFREFQGGGRYLSYQVHRNPEPKDPHFKPTDQMIFRLFDVDDPYIPEKKDFVEPLAYMIMIRVDLPGVGECYSLRHRRLYEESRKLGVTGAVFLKKLEEIMVALIEGGRLEPLPFVVEAGQVGVIEWAKNNGYKFVNPDRETFYDEIIAGDRSEYTIDNNFDDPKQGVRSGFIVKEGMIENEQARVDAVADDEDVEPIFKGFDTVNASERFILVKEI